MDYAFTITNIADYSAGLAVFMDIDNMLLSDESPDIDEGRLYSVTTRIDVERSSAVFTELIIIMIYIASEKNMLTVFQSAFVLSGRNQIY